MSNRFAIFGREKNVILPRLDPIGPERRIDPNAPLVAAYLHGRPVVLARPDPLTRRPGDPVDLTVPITLSRLRRGLDIERGRTGMPYMASAIDDWPLTHVPSVYEYSGVGDVLGASGRLGQAVVWTLGGAALGLLAGAFGDEGAGKGLVWGAALGFGAGVVMGVAET